MTDQTSKTPLEDQISELEAFIKEENRFIHRIRAMIRDASTNCEIDGYRELKPVERTGVLEWEIIRRNRRVLRLILVELP